MKISCFAEIRQTGYIKQIKKLLAFFLGILSISISYSQNSSSENNIQNAKSLYDRFTRSNAPLYNGKQYVFYTFRMKGDPYFATTKFSQGWVSYEGKKYDTASLLYDLARNELVILSIGEKYAIVLHNEAVDSFYFSNNKFIKLEMNEKRHLENTGFYNVLYDGHIQLLALRKKVMSDLIEGNSLFTLFTSKDHFYIFKNGVYYPVVNRKDVFRVLEDKRKQLKKMLRHNYIKIKKNNFENLLMKAAEFYDEIGQ